MYLIFLKYLNVNNKPLFVVKIYIMKIYGKVFYIFVNKK